MATVFFDIGDTLVAGRNWKDGAELCLEALRRTAIPIGVISNTGDLSRNDLAALLPDDFDFDLFEANLIILSSELGIEKPEPEIFLHAIKMSGQEPGNCYFVGENKSEVDVAADLGMHAVQVRYFPQDLDNLVELLTGKGIKYEQ